MGGYADAVAAAACLAALVAGAAGLIAFALPIRARTPPRSAAYRLKRSALIYVVVWLTVAAYFAMRMTRPAADRERDPQVGARSLNG